MKNNIFSILIISCLTILVYSNSMQNSFHFDDYYYITGNFHIRDLNDLAHIGSAIPTPSRYVPFLTFALNYYFHRLDVVGYHVLNIFFHILTSLFVLWFVRLLLSSPKLKEGNIGKQKDTIALLTALLFAVHPLQTQAITYLCQRFTVMATMFYLGSICFYIKGRMLKRKAYFYFIGSAISALLGMFSKQIVLTLPIAIILIECFFLNVNQTFRSYRINTSRGDSGDLILSETIAGNFLDSIHEIISKWKHIFVVLLFALVIPAMYSFNVISTLSMQSESWSHRGDFLTSKSYFLTQFSVLATYLKLLFFPFYQNLLYDYPVAHHFFEIPTVLSFLLLLFILWFARALFFQHRLISFGILWFFLTLSIESTVIVIKHVIFEHRCYLPSVGVSMVLCLGLFALMKNYKKCVSALIIIILTFSYLTFQRNKVWQTEITLWRDVIMKSPDKTRPYTHLATAYMNQGALDLALIEFTNAINTNRDNAESYNNRGNVYMKMSHQNLAMADYNQALALDPTLEKTYNNRGIIYSQMGEVDLALKDLDMAIKLNSQNPTTYFNRGNVYFKKSEHDLALKDYTAALELNSYYTDAYNQRGVVYGTKGKYVLAVKEFSKAISTGPDSAKGYWHRSLTYQAMGEYSKALADALKARSLGRNVDLKYINTLQVSIQTIQ